MGDTNVFQRTVEIMGDMFFVGGLIVLIIGASQLFLSMSSQNSDSKSHSGLLLASGIGLMTIGKVLIPMISTQVSF